MPTGTDDFDFDHAHYSCGVNDAGFEMERWWHDGTGAYELVAVGITSYHQISEADWWVLANRESDRLSELEST